MPPKSKERRSRSQPRRTAKASSATVQAAFPPLPTKTSGTIGGRVTKTPTPSKIKEKQLKSLQKEAVNDPMNLETDEATPEADPGANPEGNPEGKPEDKPEDTDTESNSTNDGKDSTPPLVLLFLRN
jgi:hypothetical protein